SEINYAFFLSAVTSNAWHVRLKEYHRDESKKRRHAGDRTPSTAPSEPPDLATNESPANAEEIKHAKEAKPNRPPKQRSSSKDVESTKAQNSPLTKSPNQVSLSEGVNAQQPTGGKLTTIKK